MKRKLQKIWEWFGGLMLIYSGVMVVYLIYRFATGLITGNHPNTTLFYIFYPALIITIIIGLRSFYGIFRGEDGCRIHYEGDKNE